MVITSPGLVRSALRLIFSSIQYLIFLPIVALIYWRLRGRARTYFLLAASYYFYMSWLPVYGLLLFGLTAVNWALGLAVDAVGAGTNKSKWILGSGVVLNLGFLCYYKYTNFFIQSVLGVFNIAAPVINAGSSPVEFPLLNIILPLGISFFVFEFIHYLIDVHRGSKAMRSLPEFALFAAFFPSQIAGPIKRYQDFMEKFRNPLPWTPELFYEGMTLIVQGMFKKIALADPLGWIVAQTFGTYAPVSSADALITIFAFSIQIFCDFSGYTDIGRGSALLLGIRLPINFATPFMAEDITSFWRRWHISLSTWIRDYVYISLGGSRISYSRTLWNLLLTMAICGLWHGAGWLFPIWGAVHGVGLVVNKLYSDFLNERPRLNAMLSTPVVRALNILVTFTFVAMAFALFRAPDMKVIVNVFTGLFTHFDMPCITWEYVEKSGVVVFSIVYLSYWLIADAIKKFRGVTEPAQLLFPAPVRMAAWTAAVLIIVAAKPTQATPFIYFQF